ncbi:MAG: tetraacyldisaccharide 4'-kinase [Calditrichaceae bacterium]
MNSATGWYDKEMKIWKMTRLLLWPFSMIYGIILDIRNLLYDLGIFKAHHYKVPVISVGNITAGGSGKTPFTIYLATGLQKYFSKIAVISRGYGRQSKGLQIVSDGKNINTNPAVTGDEPLLIAKSAPGVLVAVAEKRTLAIRHVLENFQPDLIILDDAFQHRSVKRDLDIVLINSGEPYEKNLPIPAGTLREFRHNISRADIIIHTNNTNAYPKRKIDLYNIPELYSRGALSDLVGPDFKRIGPLRELAEKKTTAFAGIAHPENFIMSLNGENITPLWTGKFKDHKEYKAEDIRKIIRHSLEKQVATVLCTEKDLVKISTNKYFLSLFANAGLKLAAPSLKIVLEDDAELLKKIYKLVDINNKS